MTAVPTGFWPTKVRKVINSLTWAVTADWVWLGSGAVGGPAAGGRAAAAAFLERGAGALPGGGVFGVGIGRLASALGRPARTGAPWTRPDLRLASATALRLVTPRTGVRVTNTHPTCGTGLPPTSRPSSNNQA